MARWGAGASEGPASVRYPFPEPAVVTLAGMALLAERRGERAAAVSSPAPPPEASAHVAALRRGGATGLGWCELGPLLAAYGIPAAASEVASTPDEAAAAATRLGAPVALKLLSPDIS